MKSFNSLILFILLSASVVYGQGNEKYKIAVTIDDLPLVRMESYNRQAYTNTFNKLVAEIKKTKTGAVGFVNGNKLLTNEKKDNSKIKLLENWLNAGLELGNHTFSHANLHKVSVADYEKDILNGEETIKGLLAKRGKTLRYFRHPYLFTGLSLEIKKEVNDFLKEYNYTIAPVTIDNAEWIFAAAYEKASDSLKTDMMKKIGEEYVSYMERKINYWESQSTALFGRNISHILLIHGNKLNSDYYGKLCEMIRKRNYQFVSLDEALKDEAYNSEDKFIRNGGISWIHRWALAKGKKGDFFGNEPECPAFIMKYAKVESE